MAFNMKIFNQKTRKVASEQSPLGKEKSLNEYNSDWSNTIDKEAIPSLDGLLGKIRGEGNSGADETVEAQMDATRNAAEDNKSVTTEAQIEKRDSWFPHRQADHYDKSPMMPINALAEARDAEYRKAYNKASLSQEKRALDKNPGSQMEGPKTKVSINVPQSGSQLNNQTTNFEIARASLKSLDAALFGIFYKAAVAKRETTAQEKQMIDRISAHKKTLVAQLVDSNPQQPQQPPMPGQQPQVPSDPAHPHGDPQSEFYPIDTNQHPQGGSSPHSDGGEDDVIIDQLLGGMDDTPKGGIGGEDINHPNYGHVQDSEHQDIAQDLLDDDSFEQDPFSQN